MSNTPLSFTRSKPAPKVKKEANNPESFRDNSHEGEDEDMEIEDESNDQIKQDD